MPKGISQKGKNIMAHNFRLNVKLLDDSGEETRKTYTMNGYTGVTFDLSFQQAFADAQDLLTDLDNATEAQIVEAGLVAYLETDNFFNTLKNSPVANSDVTDIARFTVYLDNPDINKTANHDIPAPVASGFLGASGPDAHIVDITSAKWTDYFANFAATAGGEVQISDGENVDTARGSGGIKAGVWGSKKR